MPLQLLGGAKLTPCVVLHHLACCLLFQHDGTMAAMIDLPDYAITETRMLCMAAN
jgi:hypothetical protein